MIFFHGGVVVTRLTEQDIYIYKLKPNKTTIILWETILRITLYHIKTFIILSSKGQNNERLFIAPGDIYFRTQTVSILIKSVVHRIANTQQLPTTALGYLVIYYPETQSEDYPRIKIYRPSCNGLRDLILSQSSLEDYSYSCSQPEILYHLRIA